MFWQIIVNIVKAYELRKKNKDELQKQLDSYKEELYTLRVSKVASGNQANLLNMYVVNVLFY